MKNIALNKGKKKQTTTVEIHVMSVNIVFNKN